jgi:murein tripeptide amidase MpaA
MYRTVAQIDSATEILSLWFPQLFTRVQLPEASVQGRPVYALRMRAGSGTGRRGVLIVGGTHARELMNPDAIIELAIDLLLSYSNGTNIRYGGKTFTADEVKLILEAMDIWLLPCVNPDGRHHVMTVDDMWRKNRRDNPGTPCDGVDLNRNADVVWGVAQGQTSCSPCADIYCGPSAFSEPETRNVKHILDSERIVSFVDVHSYSELVLYPWGHARTQSTDPSQRFTGLPTGTCTASIPATYSEYMPPRDVQRFRTVAGRIVTDIAAVRGRSYTPQTSYDLYATTGTQSDYAYARHIANPSLYKTYGFTFETGPYVPGNSRESFHPTDPTLIKRDGKAAILALLQQSVCAIELIGIKLFEGDTEVAALRTIRDDLLATTAGGREWIALFERAQFALLSSAVRDANLLAAAGEVIRATARSVGDKDAVFGEADSKRASSLLKKLRVKVKIRALQSDLDAVGARIEQLSGRRMQQVIESLMRHKPGKGGKAVAAKKKRTPARKRALQRR